MFRYSLNFPLAIHWPVNAIQKGSRQSPSAGNDHLPSSLRTPENQYSLQPNFIGIELASLLTLY